VVILEQKKTAQNSLEEVNSIEKKAIEKTQQLKRSLLTKRQTVAKRKHCPCSCNQNGERQFTTVVTPTVPAVKVKTTENVPVEYIKLSPAELESLIDKVME
jgi:hypothetical protein